MRQCSQIIVSGPLNATTTTVNGPCTARAGGGETGWGWGIMNSKRTKMASERIKQMVIVALGFFFVSLGFVGAMLPVLPTTPFLLVALWCFAQGSDRFHHWLYTHHLFGPTLQLWEKHRAIPPIAKVIAVTSMSGSVAYMTFFSKAPWYTIIPISAFMAYVAWWIVSRPNAASAQSLATAPATIAVQKAKHD